MDSTATIILSASRTQPSTTTLTITPLRSAAHRSANVGKEIAMLAGMFDSFTTPLQYAVLAKRAVPVILLVLFWCWETCRPYFGQQEGRVKHAARNLAIALFNTGVLA